MYLRVFSVRPPPAFSVPVIVFFDEITQGRTAKSEMSAWKSVTKIFVGVLEMVDEKHGRIPAASRNELRLILSDVCVAWLKARAIGVDTEISGEQKAELENILMAMARCFLGNPWMSVLDGVEVDESGEAYVKSSVDSMNTVRGFFRRKEKVNADFNVHPVNPRLWLRSTYEGMLNVNYMGCQPSSVWEICCAARITPLYVLYTELVNILRFKTSEKILRVLGLVPPVAAASFTPKKRDRLNQKAAKILVDIVNQNDVDLALSLRPYSTVAKWVVGNLGVASAFVSALFSAAMSQWNIFVVSLLLIPMFWKVGKSAVPKWRYNLLGLQGRLDRYYWFWGNHKNQLPAASEIKLLVSDLCRAGEAFPAVVFALLAALDGKDSDLVIEFPIDPGVDEDSDFITGQLERRFEGNVEKRLLDLPYKPS